MVKYIFIMLFISSNLFAQSEVAQREVLVDPTKPLNFQVKKVNKVYRAGLPTLQSIIIKQGKQQAILDNKMYQKGQWINGYKITKIDKKKVLLEYQNKTYKLTLYSSSERFTD
ncbi:hypothetical protein [Psychromonas hadalis]|uniref:hypothetical protein n=1 Tax=Psychromonas hadalis TaxID=211669 RepID=UPI0006850992|nr:hypothetical protein [Psychromonas hadalis]